ncbi:TPA: hypothetical protein RXP51_004930 [Escherichia coli]|jgi:hypothetical protein|uniref:Uncharacterized protein n=3 Tax=Escherichia coli TaxID=562 RepID=A0AAI9H3M6_ECOLX|nr:hypothetical protein [Escherichia coli]EFP8083134.1 hypothetical protein [Shigella flexneri]EGD4626512.1 hypothetical protein [Shigella sonnei]EHY2141989.1 hypothetical protein [Escherichia coli O157]EKE8540056.1 hypothetical protein [Salmonella enterica]HDQ6576431.1 hypothetical protein [Escherichia coli O128:H2]HDQ6695878.1 hypothetical protein [Escherichia coli O128AB:H2]HDQ6721469.1 hypothetical protein [Escherichia coli O146:H21]HDQ6793203.1 hypothetical protein [Escherichia coli O1
MMERKQLNLRINDQFLIGEIDNKLHSEKLIHKHHVTDAINTIKYLEILFTSSNLKRYKNKEHYIKHIVAKSLLPKAEEIIRIQKDEFSSHYEHLKQTVSEIPNYKDIYNHINNENKKIKIPVLISPVVMMMISLITLTDNIIKQQRILYLCGEISKKDFYSNRRVVLKKFSNVRLKLHHNRKEYSEKLSTLIEKKGMQ